MTFRTTQRVWGGSFDFRKLAGIIGIAVVIGLMSAPQASAQSKDEPVLAFEVASVRPSRAADSSMQIGPPVGGKLTARNVSLAWLIKFAYKLQWFQIGEGPKWTDSERFDVIAQAADGTVKEDQVRRMVRTLLADRFQLKIRPTAKRMPIYALVVNEKAGPDLRKAKPCPASTDTPATATPCPAFGMSAIGQLSGQSVTLSALANVLCDMTDRMVLDQTGLAGAYDIRLSWTPDQLSTPGALSGPGQPSTDALGPSIFTALREQLGLKLQPTTGPVEVYVIDRVERPSEN